MSVTVHDRPADAFGADLVRRWQAIPVAVAVDVSQSACQVDPAIRPLLPPGRQPRLFGRAVTALCQPPDFGAVLHALDLVGAGDVLVIAAGGDRETAMIGEILGGQLHRAGAAGIVCDGAVRDVGELAGWSGFGVFARAITPRGPTAAEHGRVNATVDIGGRRIGPGDLIIGDDDGLAAVDGAAAAAFIAAAEAKLRREAAWQDSLRSGRSAAQTFGLAPARREPGA